MVHCWNCGCDLTKFGKPVKEEEVKVKKVEQESDDEVVNEIVRKISTPTKSSVQLIKENNLSKARAERKRMADEKKLIKADLLKKEKLKIQEELERRKRERYLEESEEEQPKEVQTTAPVAQPAVFNPYANLF